MKITHIFPLTVLCYCSLFSQGISFQDTTQYEIENELHWILSDDTDVLIDGLSTFYRIDPRLMKAQLILESARETSNLVNTHCNYFGIMRNGDYVVYESKLKCFEAYCQLMMTSRYKDCHSLDNINDIIKCVHSSGYAEDPMYSTKLQNIVNYAINEHF